VRLVILWREKHPDSAYQPHLSAPDPPLARLNANAGKSTALDVSQAAGISAATDFGMGQGI